jgi:ABC-type oligopeptide transport system substrate-binding subunit
MKRKKQIFYIMLAVSFCLAFPTAASAADGTNVKSCVNSGGTAYTGSDAGTFASTNYYMNSKGQKALLTNNTSDQRIKIVA